MPKKGKEEGGGGRVEMFLRACPSTSPNDLPGPDRGTGSLTIQGQPDSDPKR